MANRISLSQNCKLTRDSMRDLRSKLAYLASHLLEEGCSRRTYHHLQVIFALVGNLPNLPSIEGEDGVLRMPTEEILK
jgi:hypothetical protein